MNIKKIILGVVCVVILGVVVYGGKYLISVQKYKQTVKDIAISNVNLSKISNGTYTGSCDALFVAAKVSVTVKYHKITNIILLKHKTERGKPAEVIPGIVSKGSKFAS